MYEKYKLINHFNGLKQECPHEFQTTNYDCALFTMLHAEYISQKGIKNLEVHVNQNMLKDKLIREKIYALIATYQKIDFQYVFERYNYSKTHLINGKEQKITYLAPLPMGRGRQEKPEDVVDVCGDPLGTLLEIEEDENNIEK